MLSQLLFFPLHFSHLVGVWAWMIGCSWLASSVLPFLLLPTSILYQFSFVAELSRVELIHTCSQNSKWSGVDLLLGDCIRYCPVVSRSTIHLPFSRVSCLWYTTMTTKSATMSTELGSLLDNNSWFQRDAFLDDPSALKRSTTF